jgi:hypothetical protein
MARVVAAALAALAWVAGVAAPVGASTSTWTLTPAQTPAGEVIPTFESVSCPAASECFAVGYTTSTSGVIRQLLERYDGSSWHLVSVPTRAAGWLEGVNCVTTTSCWAVGTSGGAAHHGIIDHWNGSVWTAVPSPQEPGSSTSGHGETLLNGVACRGAKNCYAVGGICKGCIVADPRNFIEYLGSALLIEHWNGSRWTWVSGVPDAGKPTGRYERLLSAISCAGTGCVAVGLSAAAGGPIAEALTGSRWIYTRLPRPANAGTLLNQVSCAAARWCVAVGQSQSNDSSSGDEPGYLAELSASGWHSTQLGYAASADEQFDPLGVSCAAIASCAVVGGGAVTSASHVAASGWWDGTTLTYDTTNTADTVSALQATVCDEVASCVGLGYVTNNTTEYPPLQGDAQGWATSS